MCIRDRASNEDIQVGIGMSAGSEPEKNFFQTHMRRNGTKENNVGAAIYVKEDSAPTELGPVLTGNPPTNPPTSTLNTHVVRLTKIDVYKRQCQSKRKFPQKEFFTQK